MFVAWKGPRRGKRLRSITTAELVTGSGEYQGVPIAERGDCLASLVELVGAHALGAHMKKLGRHF